MLNRVILMGRITHDLEVRQTPNGVPVVSFTVAVDRARTNQNGERESDFIRCVAWRQQAEFLSRYFGKGRMVALEGNIRTGSYQDKNGTTHYTTEVYVDNISFTGEPKQQGGTYQNAYGNGGYQQGGYQGGQQGGRGGYQGGNGGYQQGGQSGSDDSMAIGDLSEFEDVLSDDGVPF